MKILFYLLAFIIVVVAILLILALFLKKTHYVKRSIIINAPKDKVFSFLKLLKNQDKFNKWAREDPNRQWNYTGEDGTIGFIISWDGNKKAGKGEKEIIHIEDGKRIETQIRFIKPMVMTADVIMETEDNGDGQTKVSLINTGNVNYPLNLFIPLAEKNFPKDLDESLIALKAILEKA